MRSDTLYHSLFASIAVVLRAVTAFPLEPANSHLGVAGVDATYDYVVVGGGTAGLAIAARLSETYNVAVIEAGTYYETVNNQSTVPEYVVDFLSTTLDPTTWAPTDWGFTTTNQTAIGGSEYHYSRAKTLGGCSAYNAMIYQRGSAGSYNMWADIVGDDDYKWENFLPYFAKSVDFSIEARPANATIPAQGQGAFVEGNGPLHVEYPQYATPFGSWAQLGMKEAGFKEISDFESGVLLGTQYAPMTGNPATGTRDSSQTSFLDSAIAAGQRLTVYNGTMAQKINFNSAKEATSVQVSTHNGPAYKITAREEIIISAGAFQSPQLLMVSGIGPKATLEKFQIPVISDLPGVGQNMWDHIFYGMIWPTDVETRQRLLDPNYLAAVIEEYHETHHTIMSSNALDYFGWEKLTNRTQLSKATLAELATFPADWPEIEYISGSLANPALPKEYRDYTVLIPALVAPTSRGSVTISSASMNDHPVIDPKWLSTTADQEQAVAALKRVRQIMATDAIQGGLVGPEIVPGATVQTDEEILAYILSSFSTVWHASCTCAMGKETDPMAVLDSKARVYGVYGLRVVDASAMPLLPPGHPMSTIYALAEKIAEDIKRGGC